MDINFTKNLGGGISQLPKPTGGPRNYIIEAVLLLIVCGLLVWFIVLPKKAEVASRNEDFAKLEVQKSKIKSESDELNKLIQKLNVSEKEIKDLDTALPLVHNAIQFELLIKNIAGSVNVSVGSLNLSSKPELVVAGDKALIDNPFAVKRSLQKLSGSIYAIGTLDQLLAFLKKIERSGRYISVTSVQMDPGADNNLNLRMSVDVYYFGQ